MTAPPLTPSPYLRDHLLTAARGLRKDAEAARLNLAEAEQDVAAARELLAEAEAQERRARAEVDGIARDVAWLEGEAAARTAEIDAAAAAHHAATRLVHEDPGPVSAEIYQENGLPMVWSDLCAPGGYVCAMPAPLDGPGIPAPGGGAWICGQPVESEPCTLHDPPPVNVARTPEQVIAALTGSTPTIPDDPPGEVVATSGPGTTGPLPPTVTAPDPGLAHPVPNPPGPDDGADRPRHAKPSRWTGGWPVIGRRKPTDQDGDQQ